MFALVLASLARFCRAMKFGTAIAAGMPMITTTIISSIRVKPRWARCCSAVSGAPTRGEESGVIYPVLLHPACHAPLARQDTVTAL